MSVTSIKSDRNVHELNSGVVIDLLDFDKHDLETIEDCHDAMSVIERKIIEIEYQINCMGMGYHPDGEPLSQERMPPPLWEPRAKKALAMTRLQKSEVQHRIQMISKEVNARENAERQKNIASAFVDCAKVQLPPETFKLILETAIASTGSGIRSVSKANGK